MSLPPDDLLTPGSNHDSSHAGQKPGISQKSKADQLARTRRNQQRCRERKRAHIAELESQVDALQAKIRQCEPCDSCVSPSTIAHESALETVTRENAARRDLLAALGFDDEAQQRFIESAARRQAVHTILHGDSTQRSTLSTPDFALAQQPTGHRRQAVGSTAKAAKASGGSRPGMLLSTAADTAEEVTADINLDELMSVIDPATESWLFSQETLANIPASLPDHSSYMPWPPDRQNSVGDTTSALMNAFRPKDAMIDFNHTLPLSRESLNSDSSWTTTPSVTPQQQCGTTSSASSSTQRCFLDTVVQVPSGESSTVCSVALATLFKNNRRGLSMAELERRLKSGMLAPSEGSGECRIENSVLFRVLAHISS